jgi:hypothetical protein
MTTYWGSTLLHSHDKFQLSRVGMELDAVAREKPFSELESACPPLFVVLLRNRNHISLFKLQISSLSISPLVSTIQKRKSNKGTNLGRLEIE